MNHEDLIKTMTEDLRDLRTGKIKPQLAKELFNGAGKIISLTMVELKANEMGYAVSVPILGITALDVEKNQINKSEVLREIGVKKPYKVSK